MLIILRDKTLPRFPSLAAGNLLDLRFWSSVILGKYATADLVAKVDASFGAASFWVSTQQIVRADIGDLVLEQRHSG